MIKIKKSNCNAIHDFAVHNERQIINGTKLKALYFLIQKKGEIIETKDENLKGLKCLEYQKGIYIAIKHKPVKKNSFFPCMIKTIQLTQL